MKNLVISVSHDSSLELLGAHADVLILDKNQNDVTSTHYDTVYIRSHFSRPSTLPQKFRSETDDLVNAVKTINPNVRFIDDMSTVDAIVAFEDKWQQYKTFGHYMPRTELFDVGTDITSFRRPIYKNRLSSRGTGVTWDQEKALDTAGKWIVQESLSIDEELRVYVICGEVYPIGTIRQSKTEERALETKSTRALTQNEIDFCLKLASLAPDLDMIGVDIACTSDEGLSLIEVNRSPGFAKFYELADVNLADLLYKS